MVVLGFHAMNAQARKARRPLGIIGRDHACIAVRPQVLRRVKAETSQMPQRTCFLALIVRPERLRRIFDDVQTVPLG
ncbi:hypothetical protein HRbin36_02274 [bacterium HR36]|nr:hypothetical protein HRbin36_02274 [bacterium HR36]